MILCLLHMWKLITFAFRVLSLIRSNPLGSQVSFRYETVYRGRIDKATRAFKNVEIFK